jgi:hypothetical protein
MTDPTPSIPTPTPAEQTGEQAFPGSRRAALAAYVEVNRERYTEAALRAAALQAGFRSEEFDAVWPAVGWAHPADGPRAKVDVMPSLATFIGFILVLWLGAVALESIASASGTYIAPTGPILWVVMLILGVIGWLLLRESHPSVSRGLGCAVIAVGLFPIIAIVAVLGVCLVTGATVL